MRASFLWVISWWIALGLAGLDACLQFSSNVKMTHFLSCFDVTPEIFLIFSSQVSESYDYCRPYGIWPHTNPANDPPLRETKSKPKSEICPKGSSKTHFVAFKVCHLQLVRSCGLGLLVARILVFFFASFFLKMKFINLVVVKTFWFEQIMANFLNYPSSFLIVGESWKVFD